MKHAILMSILIVLCTATGLSALTLDAVAKRNTVYRQPVKISKTFGRLPSSGEYGIFLHVTLRVEQGYSGNRSLFFRLRNGMAQDGQFLYTMVNGKKVILAEKSWLAWRPADGVSIRYRIEKSHYPTFKVWLEVDNGP